MSKLGTILHPRTLPPAPKSGLFADCNPAVPEMLNPLVKSWQDTDTFAVIYAPSNVQTAEPEATSLEQAVVLREATRSCAGINAQHEEADCPWLSRLAVEWQVGIETLVPLTSPGATPHKTLTRLVATVFDTTTLATPADKEPGIDPEETNCPESGLESRQSASTTYLADRLMEAVHNGAASTVEQVLQLINRQSQSTVAVLLELKERFAITANTPLTVDWETGSGANGKSFTRISFTMMNDWTKGSGATKLIIGSDGTTYATFTERWNSTPLYLSPDEAIAKVKGNSLKPVRDFFNKPLQKPTAIASRPPRHFKAAGF